MRHSEMNQMQENDTNIKTALVYLIIQESQELVSIWRHLLRAARMFQLEDKHIDKVA